jgi:hypothetical protein
MTTKDFGDTLSIGMLIVINNCKDKKQSALYQRKLTNSLQALEEALTHRKRKKEII